MKETLEAALKKLRLSGLASALDVRLQEAKANRLNHVEFLELVLQDELAAAPHLRPPQRSPEKGPWPFPQASADASAPGGWPGPEEIPFSLYVEWITGGSKSLESCRMPLNRSE